MVSDLTGMVSEFRLAYNVILCLKSIQVSFEGRFCINHNGLLTGQAN